MARDEKHAFIRIGEDIKDGNIPPVVLLFGKEEFLVNFYADALSRRYVSKASEALDLITLERGEATVSKVIEEFETLPLMSERKVVKLPYFIDAKGRYPELFGKGKESVEELARYIEGAGAVSTGDDASTTESSSRLLIITFAKPKDERDEREAKKSPIYKAVSKVGAVYEFTPLDGAQLRAFIEKRFHAAGKKYRPGIVSLIARETGYGSKGVDYGLFTLENDIRKIIAHCGKSDEISADDVMSVITLSPENNVFTMIDAISKNRKDEAFKLLHNLLEDGSNVFQLQALIVKQLELMLSACEMKDEGMNLTAIQAALKKSDRVHEYRTKLALETGNRFRRQHLKRVLLEAYEIESNIKSGLMPEKLALEYFIAEI